MYKPHCYGKMTWILKYPEDKIPQSSICDCAYKKKCLKLTLNPESKKEEQEFQLGDIAYMFDEDYSCFESRVNRIGLNDGKYYYETPDVDFEIKDIGKWVFKSEDERSEYLETSFL